MTTMMHITDLDDLTLPDDVSGRLADVIERRAEMMTSAGCGEVAIRQMAQKEIGRAVLAEVDFVVQIVPGGEDGGAIIQVLTEASLWTNSGPIAY